MFFGLFNNTRKREELREKLLAKYDERLTVLSQQSFLFDVYLEAIYQLKTGVNPRSVERMVNKNLNIWSKVSLCF